MLTSLTLLFLVGLGLAAVFERLKLPRILGMLLAGVLLGPCAVNVLDAPLLGISAELRQMALIVILLRAGLSLNMGDLRKVGRPALLAVMSMACVCRIKCPAETTAHLSAKLGNVWLGAEVLLFGLLGDVLLALDTTALTSTRALWQARDAIAQNATFELVFWRDGMYYAATMER